LEILERRQVFVGQGLEEDIDFVGGWAGERLGGGGEPSQTAAQWGGGGGVGW
jgi:hypothetical protein